MKFLIITTFLIGACVAQQRRVSIQPQSQPQAQDQQQYDEGNDQQYDQRQGKAQQQQYQQSPSRQQYQEPRPKGYESTTFIPIIRFDKEQGNDGSYKASWETGNNIVAEEEGYVKDLGPDPDQEGQNLGAQVQQGSYSYTSPDGTLISVSYVADEKGFHPTGDHLPTPPPVSPEVQKGLDLIYAGIRAQQEADERDARENPGKLRDENRNNNDGQYRQ